MVGVCCCITLEVKLCVARFDNNAKFVDRKALNLTFEDDSINVGISCDV